MFIFGMCWGGGKIEPYNLDQLFQHSDSVTMLSNRKIGSLILSKVAWNIRLQIQKLKYGFKNVEYEEYKRYQNAISFFHISLCILETFVFHASRFPSFEGRRKFHRA